MQSCSWSGGEACADAAAGNSLAAVIAYLFKMARASVEMNFNWTRTGNNRKQTIFRM
jgi:hypothetical protein